MFEYKGFDIVVEESTLFSEQDYTVFSKGVCYKASSPAGVTFATTALEALNLNKDLIDLLP